MLGHALATNTSKIKYKTFFVFRFLSSFGIVLCFFLKTRFRVTNKNFKIIFASSLGSVGIIRPTLINSYLPYFVGCPANQYIQYQIKDIGTVFLCLAVLPSFFLKLTFELERVTAKTFFATSLESLAVSRPNLVN